MNQNWWALTPEIILAGAGLGLLLLDALRPRARGIEFAGLALLAVVASGVASVAQWGYEPASAYAGMVSADRFGVAARLVVLVSAGLAILTARGYLNPRGMDTAEFYSLLLFSTVGMTLLVVSSDLIMVFLAIELLSLALYVMAGLDRRRLESQEAAMKYFLLGAFSSSFLLFGTAFVFGGTKTTNLIVLGTRTAQSAVADFGLLGIGIALVIVGLGFKVAMVPFHMWTPDTYQGAPTPVTAFMAAGTKAAAFAALVRILIGGLNQLRWDWRPPLIVIAVVTIVFASVLAVAQTDLKRMLAYSSIAHAGFIAIGLIAGSRTGVASVLVYLAVYAAMTIGAFSCIMLFSPDDDTNLASFAGLGAKRPAAAGLFAFFLFALAGIPPTGGFFAKFYVFLAAVRAGYTWLAVLAVVASVVAAFFYIRVAVVMFMQEPVESTSAEPSRPAGLLAALAVSGAIVVLAGFVPGFLIDLAGRAVQFAH